MTDDEVTAVEKIVNEQILRDVPVETKTMGLADARKAGAMALFGEKYADRVRVVSVPGFSMELCGGTHVENVAQIGPFFVTLETGIASGIRRIEAITGREAVNFMLAAKRFRAQTAAVVNRPEEDALAGVEQLRDNVKLLEKELKKTKAAMFSGGGSNSVGEEKAVGDLTLITHDFGESDRETMGAWLDTQKGADRAVLALAMGMVDGKSTFMAAASSAAEKDLGIHVGNLVRAGLPEFGGRGGGKPSFAQGSTADGTKPSDVFDYFEAKIREGVPQK
jgi:alanyl-tRNA synthetase